MRVLIADDHSIVRSGLTYLLADLDPAAAVSAVTSFGQLRERLEADAAPDLIVMDLRMPGLAGPDEVGELVRRVAPVPVVVFSMVDSPDDMRAVLARGVRAFIPKSTDDVLVLNILRLVLAGGSYMPPVLGMPAAAPPPPPLLFFRQEGRQEGRQESRPAGAGGQEPMAVLAGLTRRQLDVLELMTEGLSNQDIGLRLGLNLSTVKTHVTAVLKALGVTSRTQAVLLVQDWRRDGHSH